jgi:hypothetical protein
MGVATGGMGVAMAGIGIAVAVEGTGATALGVYTITALIAIINIGRTRIPQAT